MKEMIYLDNAATTKTRQEVVDAMLPYFTEYYGNASAVYDFGAKAREATVLPPPVGTVKVKRPGSRCNPSWIQRSKMVQRWVLRGPFGGNQPAM